MSPGRAVTLKPGESLFFLLELGTKARVKHMLSMCYPTEIHPNTQTKLSADIWSCYYLT